MMTFVGKYTCTQVRAEDGAQEFTLNGDCVLSDKFSHLHTVWFTGIDRARNVSAGMQGEMMYVTSLSRGHLVFLPL